MTSRLLRLILSLGLGLGAALLAVGISHTPLQARADGAAMAVSPNVGPAGTVVVVRGSGFAPLTTIAFTWNDHQPMQTPLGIVTTDASGAFECPAQIPPDAQAGSGRVLGTTWREVGESTFNVTLVGGLSGAPAPVPGTAVGPSPSPSPTSAPSPEPSPTVPAPDPAPSPSSAPAPDSGPVSAPPAPAPAPQPDRAPAPTAIRPAPPAAPGAPIEANQAPTETLSTVVIYRIHRLLNAESLVASEDSAPVEPASAVAGRVSTASLATQVQQHSYARINGAIIRLTDLALASWGQSAWFGPTHPLRFIEDLREWVAGLTASTPAQSLNHHLGLANLRLHEAQAAAGHGDLANARRLLKAYDHELAQVRATRRGISPATGNSQASGLVGDNAYRQHAVLESMLRSGSGALRPDVTRELRALQPLVPAEKPATLTLAPAGR